DLDVPLVVGTDYRVNSTLTRTSANEVFDQIILDLKNAVKLLLPDKTFGEGDSIRPNRWAAAALLARVHLYKENWQDAVQEASSVINSGVYNLNDLGSTFLKNSSEAIWQLGSVNRNTNEAAIFINVLSPKNAAITESMLDSFSQEDQRIPLWTDFSTDGEYTWYFPYKYKNTDSGVITEYSIVLRLAEQYL